MYFVFKKRKKIIFFAQKLLIDTKKKTNPTLKRIVNFEK